MQAGEEAKLLSSFAAIRSATMTYLSETSSFVIKHFETIRKNRNCLHAVIQIGRRIPCGGRFLRSLLP
jgi:hypothetical protein